MSLVELMVSIFILAIVLLALLTTLVASLGAVQENEAHVRATALANELLERLAAQPWDLLALYVDEAPALTFESEPVVLLPSESPRDTRVPLPSQPVNRDGREYRVDRWITWVDGDGTGADQDYKRLVTELSWEVGGELRSMRVQTLRAPNPEEMIDLAVTFTVLANASAGGAELSLAGSSPHTNVEAIDIQIEVTDPAANATVSYVDRSGTRRDLPTPTGSEVRDLYISAGGSEFPHGPVSFAVTAWTDTSTASNTGTLTFYQPLVVGLPAITHVDGRDPICVDSGGQPLSELRVRVIVEGLTAAAAGGGNVRLTWRNTGSDSDSVLALTPVESTLAGTILEGTIPGPFVPDSVSFTVTAVRDAINDAYDATETTAPVSFPVVTNTEASPC